MQIIISSILSSVGVLATLVYFKVPSKLNELPSYSVVYWLQAAFNRTPLNVLARKTCMKLLQKFPVFRMWQFGGWGVVVNDPEAISKVLGNVKLFPKIVMKQAYPESVLGKAMGTNIFFSNGDEWKRYRQILSPPFKKQINYELILNAVQDFCSVIDTKFQNNPVPIFSYMQRITYDFLGPAILNLDLKTVLSDNVEFINHYNAIMVASLDPFYLAMPSLDKSWNPFRRSLNKHFEWLDNFLIQVVQEKMQAGIPKDRDLDMFSLMIQAHEDETQLSIQEIRDNTMLLLLPGLTTSSTLTHVLHHLAIDKDIQSKLREEVKDASKEQDFEKIKNLPYLSAIIKESMRLNPTLAKLPPRITAADTELAGYTIPSGTSVVIDLYNMQRDPKIWKDPLTFSPDRFLNPLPSTKSWFTFGGGMRTCVGMNLALVEMKVILATLISQYDISYPKETKPELVYLPTQLLIPTNVELSFSKLSEL